MSMLTSARAWTPGKDLLMLRAWRKGDMFYVFRLRLSERLKLQLLAKPQAAPLGAAKRMNAWRKSGDFRYVAEVARLPMPFILLAALRFAALLLEFLEERS